MITDRPAATAAAAAIAAAPLPYSVRRRIFLYLGLLIVLLGFGSPSGGLIDIPITFLLKNRLHLEAHELAQFRLISAIPLYLSFVFGFIRDTWNPFGMGDRGFMLLFGAITAALYVLFGFTPVTYATLLVAVVLLTTSFLFVTSAQNGLTSTIGQQHVMSGQVSAVWNIFASVPTVGALLVGGTLSDVLEERSVEEAARILFLHSDFHAVRPSLSKLPIKDLALVGDRCRDSTDGSAALHSFGDRGFDRGGAHRAHGWCCHRLLFGPDHSVMPYRPAGDDAHDVERPLFHRLAIW
jgi:BT1 family